MTIAVQNFETSARSEQVLGSMVHTWNDIHQLLDELSPQEARSGDDLLQHVTDGIAFITFEYGIDGVTMEIAKYAACLENLLENVNDSVPIHCIGGNFTESADHVLLPRWHRHLIPGTNGWSKWDDGEPFSRMFYQDMPRKSKVSREMAQEIWRQAVEFARELLQYFETHQIGLLVPVNINSNPGNPSLALGVVLASELAGLPVLNSNHDFYWESGKPSSERRDDEKPGARDHFFRNSANASFFSLLQRIFPWNGEHWIQLLINQRQLETLANHYRLPRSKMIELGTFIEDNFFTPCTEERRRELRMRLGLILGHGERIVQVRPLDDFVAKVESWMVDQQPVVCGGESGEFYDISDAHSLWFLQPTRVVTRKRIERDWELIGTLLDYAPFRSMFEQNPDFTITLHVTGPVPLEHRDDLIRVLDAYRRVLDAAPSFARRRIFQAFSAGHLGNSAFHERSLENLTVADLYHLSDLVLLPSETEGRGLPILEASAAGRPLACSRYEPREVFENVIGESLTPDFRIQYSPLPEDHYNTALLQEITDMTFLPAYGASRSLHNRRAVAGRYSMRDVTRTFASALEKLGDST